MYFGCFLNITAFIILLVFPIVPFLLQYNTNNRKTLIVENMFSLGCLCMCDYIYWCKSLLHRSFISVLHYQITLQYIPVSSQFIIVAGLCETCSSSTQNDHSLWGLCANEGKGTLGNLHVHRWGWKRTFKYALTAMTYNSFCDRGITIKDSIIHQNVKWEATDYKLKYSRRKIKKNNTIKSFKAFLYKHNVEMEYG